MTTIKFKNDKVACTTDIHIGAHQDSPVWHEISLNYAKWLKQKLIDNDIEDLIICGDINNNRNEISVNSIHVISQFFTILKQFNIILIVGNHDAYYKNRPDIHSLSMFSGWPNITIIDEVTAIKIFGADMAFCPWGTELSDIPKCDILFGHFEISGFSLSQMKICKKGLRSNTLLNKTDLIISGHFHSRENRKYKNGRILYLGSPYELDWGSCGSEPKGFYTLDIPKKTLKFIHNDISPLHKRIRLSEITSGGSLSEDIKEEFKGNFVNFVIDQDLPFDKTEDFINSLDVLKAKDIKTDWILEDRVSQEDSDYEFTGVDIATSISEFVKLTDLKEKDGISKKTLELFEKYRSD